MKKLLSALILVTGLLLSACLNEETSFDPDKDKEKPLPSPAVWIVSDADSKLFMIGDVPLVPKRIDWETGPIRLAASQSKTLILENDPSEKASLRGVMLTQELGFYSDGTKLTDNLDDRGMKNLNLATTRLGMPEGALNNLKPWLAAATLALGAGESEELTSKNSLVEKLRGEAEVKGHTMMFLSSPEQRVRDIADLSPDVHLKYLDRTLSDFSGLGEGMIKAADSWQQGDIGALKSRSVNLYTQMPSSAYQGLIQSRNAQYIGKLVNFLEGQGDGIAIIAMPHLIDQGNLQVMLRDRGYKVERYDGTN